MFNEKMKRILFSLGCTPFLITSFGAPAASLIATSAAIHFSSDVETIATDEVTEVVDQKEFHELVKPLADLISKGEGDYNAVNRGWAGDTPGGIKRLTGSSFAGFTVRQVMGMQNRWIYAVGRYQFIPKTLRYAVAMNPDVSLDDKFTPEVQDRLFATLIEHKRPAVGAYIRGEHTNLGWALDELAREWASVEYRYGRGYYDHIGGNRAHISRHSAAEALNTVRTNYTSEA